LVGWLIGWLVIDCKLDTLADGRSSDIMSLKNYEFATCIYLRNSSEFDLKKYHCNFLKLYLANNEIAYFENQITCQPPTGETTVCFQVSPCEICGGQNGTGTGFSPSMLVFHCHHQSTDTQHSFIHSSITSAAYLCSSQVCYRTHFENAVFCAPYIYFHIFLF
jgi:hypothetical protein